MSWASVPDSNGSIRACYKPLSNKASNVRIIDTSAPASSWQSHCATTEVEIDWNQQGATGANGLDGADGAPGTNGLDGQPGQVGPAGPAAEMGPIGPAGPQGTPGADGLPGSPGIQGPKGATGDAGPSGPQGPQGLPGGSVTGGVGGIAAWNSMVQTSISVGGTYVFLGIPANISTSENQAVFGSATASIAIITGGASVADLSLCYQPQAGGTITPLVPGLSVVVGTQRFTQGVSGSSTMTAGDWKVGMCLKNNGPTTIANSDRVSGWLIKI